MYAGRWDDDTMPCVHSDEDTDDKATKLSNQIDTDHLLHCIVSLIIIARPDFTQFFPGIDQVEIIIWCDLFTDEMR